jgi:hypothetical protein
MNSISAKRCFRNMLEFFLTRSNSYVYLGQCVLRHMRKRIDITILMPLVITAIPSFSHAQLSQSRMPVAERACERGAELSSEYAFKLGRIIKSLLENSEPEDRKKATFEMLKKEALNSIEETKDILYEKEKEEVAKRPGDEDYKIATNVWFKSLLLTTTFSHEEAFANPGRTKIYYQRTLESRCMKVWTDRR